MSTQLVPIGEAEWARKKLLPPFTKKTGIEVVFIGVDYGELASRVMAESDAGKGSIALISGLHSDLVDLYPYLYDLTPILNSLKGRRFSPAILSLGRINGIQAYIPWTQGSYLLVINKKALRYLPPDVDVWNLTYADLLAWLKEIHGATGRRPFGLPAGPRGLIHRFIHGYLYPSFTGYQVKRFESPEAVRMWQFFKELWRYTNPSSPIWDGLDTPLLSEEAWIGWDHSARLKPAIVERPEDFILVPAPRGPKGRGVILVLAGLAIPKSSPDKESAARLIEYLTRPDVQIKILEGVGFLPVIKEADQHLGQGPMKIITTGINGQMGCGDIKIATIPKGLGPRSGEFIRIYREAFREIVIKNRPIGSVLERKGKELRRLFSETDAPLPAPDHN